MALEEDTSQLGKSGPKRWFKEMMWESFCLRLFCFIVIAVPTYRLMFSKVAFDWGEVPTAMVYAGSMFIIALVLAWTMPTRKDSKSRPVTYPFSIALATIFALESMTQPSQAETGTPLLSLVALEQEQYTVTLEPVTGGDPKVVSFQNAQPFLGLGGRQVLLSDGTLYLVSEKDGRFYLTDTSGTVYAVPQTQLACRLLFLGIATVVTIGLTSLGCHMYQCINKTMSNSVWQMTNEDTYYPEPPEPPPTPPTEFPPLQNGPLLAGESGNVSPSDGNVAVRNVSTNGLKDWMGNTIQTEMEFIIYPTNMTITDVFGVTRTVNIQTSTDLKTWSDDEPMFVREWISQDVTGGGNTMQVTWKYGQPFMTNWSTLQKVSLDTGGSMYVENPVCSLRGIPKKPGETQRFWRVPSDIQLK